jgi:hypothetical protein
LLLDGFAQSPGMPVARTRALRLRVALVGPSVLALVMGRDATEQARGMVLNAVLQGS